MTLLPYQNGNNTVALVELLHRINMELDDFRSPKVYLGSICTAEAKSKVPDWGIKSTLAYRVIRGLPNAHGKCVVVDSGVDIS